MFCWVLTCAVAIGVDVHAVIGATQLSRDDGTPFAFWGYGNEPFRLGHPVPAVGTVRRFLELTHQHQPSQTNSEPERIELYIVLEFIRSIDVDDIDRIGLIITDFLPLAPL